MHLYKYPQDSTGSAPSNLVVREPHDLSAYRGQTHRPVVLNHGYFYAASLVMLDETATPYYLNQDFKVVLTHTELTQKTGQLVCGAIIITNPNVGDEVYIDAQMVGGMYSHVGESVDQLLTMMEADDRPINWYNIQDRPPAFTPSGHLHPLWELYGFGPYADTIQQMADSEKVGSRSALAGIRSSFDGQMTAYRDTHDDLQADLDAHLANTNDPHRLTKGQVDLDEIHNYPPATLTSAIEGASETQYQTLASLKAQVDALLLDVLTAHKNNQDNPHQLTTAQLDVPTRGAIDRALTTKLDDDATAVNSGLFMGDTPAGVANDVHTDMNASELNQGRLDPVRIGSGNTTRDHILTGNGQWTSVDALVEQYADPGTQVLYIGYQGRPSNALNHIRSTYTDINSYPVGTIIIYTERVFHPTDWGNGAYGGGQLAAVGTAGDYYSGVLFTTDQAVGWVGTATNAVVRTAGGWSTMGGGNIDNVHYVPHEPRSGGNSTRFPYT